MMSASQTLKRFPTAVGRRLPRRDFLKGASSLGALALASHLVPGCTPASDPAPARATLGDGGELPEPRKDSQVSIEQTLSERRSIRSYTGGALTLGEVSQLLWAAQGITNDKGYRTAPSASATFPLELYLVVGGVDDLAAGVYSYKPAGHRLVKLRDGDLRFRLTPAQAGLYVVEGGAVYIVVAAVFSRTTGGSSEARKYVYMEVGHAAQNVYLQAVSLGLGTVVNGGIIPDNVREILDLPLNIEPVYLMPVGRV